jgi:hypothetical protein
LQVHQAAGERQRDYIFSPFCCWDLTAHRMTLGLK